MFSFRKETDGKQRSINEEERRFNFFLAQATCSAFWAGVAYISTVQKVVLLVRLDRARSPQVTLFWRSWAVFSRVLRDSTPRFVRQSVGWSVGRSVTFYFFYDFYFLTSLLLPKWSDDLKYGPCPLVRD